MILRQENREFLGRENNEKIYIWEPSQKGLFLLLKHLHSIYVLSSSSSIILGPLPPTV
jgi:hypothetical protein